jgi:hypothetical protein
VISVIGSVRGEAAAMAAVLATSVSQDVASHLFHEFVKSMNAAVTTSALGHRSRRRTKSKPPE